MLADFLRAHDSLFFSLLRCPPSSTRSLDSRLHNSLLVCLETTSQEVPRLHRESSTSNISQFFVIPTVFTVTCAISTLLSVLVILGRLFSTPIPYDDFLKMGHNVVNGAEGSFFFPPGDSS